MYNLSTAILVIRVILVLPLVPVALHPGQLAAVLQLVPPALLRLEDAEGDEAVVRELRVVLLHLREEGQLELVRLLLLA